MANEYVKVGILLLIMIVILKIAFYKDTLGNAAKFGLSLFWLFMLPGYCIMLRWKNELEFLERMFLGGLIAAALLGILSYYLGLMGMHVKFHHYILPLVLIVVGIVFSKSKFAKQGNDATHS